MAVPTTFTENDVVQFITRRIPQAEFANLVVQYCSPQLNEGDGIFIKQYPSILVLLFTPCCNCLPCFVLASVFAVVLDSSA
jgi:hypothetical protein